MTTLVASLWIIVSLALLYSGAELLVRGATSLALRLGISALLIGLTVVAYCTITPELLVSVQGALAGAGDIAIGNVVGSNVFNIAAILGLAAMVGPVAGRARILQADIPLLLGATVAMLLFLWDQTVERWEAALLVLAMVAYTATNVWLSRQRRQTLSPTGEANAAADDLPATGPGRWWVALLLLGGRGARLALEQPPVGGQRHYARLAVWGE